MAIVFTGSKTVTNNQSPYLTGAALTTLLAIAPENMTRGQMKQILDAMARVSGGADKNAVVGTILT